MKVRNRKENILDMYMKAAGKSEVPRIFHEWCCLTTVAAAVGNRVGFYTTPFKRVKPHLYTFLIADSGVGKGMALDFAAQFRFPIMNVYNGALTHKRMIDLLKQESKPDEAYFDYSNLFLNSAELANTAGTDALAKQLIKAMTDWYTAHGMQVEGTRTHGDNEYMEPTINWIAGTTIEWLTDVVDHKALRSGFFGRVVPVLGRRQPRMEKAIYPEDYNEIIAAIRDRIEDLTYVRGDFTMTPGAEQEAARWYMERAEPPKELEAFFARERILALKLAMVLSLCESQALTIRKRHVVDAQSLVEDARRMFAHVCDDATASHSYQNMQRVLHTIKDHAQISHVDLQRRMQKHISGPALQSILDELLDLKYVALVTFAGSEARHYKYTGRGRLINMKRVKT